MGIKSKIIHIIKTIPLILKKIYYFIKKLFIILESFFNTLFKILFSFIILRIYKLINYLINLGVSIKFIIIRFIKGLLLYLITTLLFIVKYLFINFKNILSHKIQRIYPVYIKLINYLINFNISIKFTIHFYRLKLIDLFNITPPYIVKIIKYIPPFINKKISELKKSKVALKLTILKIELLSFFRLTLFKKIVIVVILLSIFTFFGYVCYLDFYTPYGYKHTLNTFLNPAGWYFYKANRLLNNNSIDEAITLYNKAIEIDDKFLPAYLQLAEVYEKTNQIKKAILCLEKANKIEPEIDKVHLNLARLYEKENNFIKAINEYKKLKKIHPYMQEVYYYLGVAHYKNKEEIAAIPFFEKCILFDRNSIWAMQSRVWLKKIQKETFLIE